MAKLSKLQLDWFDVFMRVPIRQTFVPFGQALETLEQLKVQNIRVISLEFKQGGYELQLKES